MLKSEKNVFWEALLVTVLVFAIGIILGVVLENWRTSKVDDFFQYSEIELLDIKTQNEVYSLGDLDCEFVIKENLLFADRIYEEAKVLIKYDGAARLTDAIKLEHKKYDILRALLWVNSIKIKKECKSRYHNVVYIYDYNDPSLDTGNKQGVFSKLLGDLKEEKGEDMLLIPMAGDNNLSSINILMARYNITEEELPVILIDEKTKVTEVLTLEELGKLVR